MTTSLADVELIVTMVEKCIDSVDICECLEDKES